MESRTLQEILNDLKKPIPSKFLDTNEHEGTTYFPIGVYKFMLSDRAPFHETSCHTNIVSLATPEKADKGQVNYGFVTCDVSITITGSDGSITRSANGFEVIQKKMYGDGATNAYAQAFKLACKALGLGKREKDAQSNNGTSKQRPTQSRDPRSEPPQEGELTPDQMIGLLRNMLDEAYQGGPTHLQKGIAAANKRIGTFPSNKRGEVKQMIKGYEDRLKQMDQHPNATAPAFQDHRQAAESDMPAEFYS